VSLGVSHTSEKGMWKTVCENGTWKRYVCVKGMWERWGRYLCEKGMWRWYVKKVCEDGMWKRYVKKVCETGIWNWYLKLVFEEGSDCNTLLKPIWISNYIETPLPYSMMAPLDSRLPILRWVVYSVVDRNTLPHAITYQVLDSTLLLLVFFILPCLTFDAIH